MTNASRRIRTAVTAAALLVTAAPTLHAETPDERHAVRNARGALVCPPVTKTGTYRVAIERQGAEPTFALLVLERAAGCLSALIITDEGPTAVEIKDVDAASLTGVLRAGRQPAVIELHFTETGVIGAMAHKSRKWTVSGERTS